MSRAVVEGDVSREPKSKWRPSSSGTLNEEWETPKRRPRNSWARNELRSEVPRSRESSFDHSNQKRANSRARDSPRKDSSHVRADSLSHRESFDGGYSVGPSPPPPWPLKRELPSSLKNQPMKPFNRKTLQEIAIKIAGHLAGRLSPQSPITPPLLSETVPPQLENQKLRKILSKKLFEKHLDEAYLIQQERKLSADLSEDPKTTPSSVCSSEQGQGEDYSVSPVLSLVLNKDEFKQPASDSSILPSDREGFSESDKEEADRSRKRLFTEASTESMRSPILEDFDSKIQIASRKHYFPMNALKHNALCVLLCIVALEIMRIALR